MAIGTVAPPIGAVELSTRQPLDSLDSSGTLRHCRAVESCRAAVDSTASTAAVEAVELSRSCRGLSRIAVELSSRGSDEPLGALNNVRPCFSFTSKMKDPLY